MEKVFIFIFGSLVGSFLNVCIHRMPLGESVVFPASHCPKCRKPIAWYDNIPLVSYALLAGKCRSCKQKISVRYFVVELLTALAFLACWMRWGLSYGFFVYLIFICGLIVATFVDITHRIIPDEISLGGIVVGFAMKSVSGFSSRPVSFSYQPLVESLLGIAIGGGIIWLTGFVFDLVYFKLLKKGPVSGETTSMGGGDVKLLAAIGAFLGWQPTVMTFFLAPAMGALIGIANLLITKDHTIPYGPFLSLAAVISLFWFHPILRFIIPVY
jgi:leader peptidase (prepilin peptidase)/N-methyltransferase